MNYNSFNLLLTAQGVCASKSVLFTILKIHNSTLVNYVARNKLKELFSIMCGNNNILHKYIISNCEHI